MLLGQAQDSPLLVTVAAGAAALPTLLKLATVISDQVLTSACGCCSLLLVQALAAALRCSRSCLTSLKLPPPPPLPFVQPQPAADLAGAAEQLPVELPLGREFVFHSIFACPVSRDQVGASAVCSVDCMGGLNLGEQKGRLYRRAQPLHTLVGAPLPSFSHPQLALP